MVLVAVSSTKSTKVQTLGTGHIQWENEDTRHHLQLMETHVNTMVNTDNFTFRLKA